MKKPTLSLIIPVYNEEDRIDNIHRLFAFLKSFPWYTEVLIVNDGSTDGTLGKANILRQRYDFILVSRGAHRGKGAAVRAGVRRARGTYICFMDIDLSVPPEFLMHFMEQRQKGDIIIATRRHPQSRLLVRQHPVRELLGAAFSWLVRRWLGIPVSDVTCGLKLFKAGVAKKLFVSATIDGWAFDAEILYHAYNAGLRIIEVPVGWRNGKNSKVRLLRDTIQSLVDIIGLRIY